MPRRNMGIHAIRKLMVINISIIEQHCKKNSVLATAQGVLNERHKKTKNTKNSKDTRSRN